MYNQIKKIFKSKIHENIQTLDKENYYYFYQDHTCKKIFAIKKDITASEYSLLKVLFVEKRQYAQNSKEQKVYEYLFENKEYPFNDELSFIAFSAFDSDVQTINKVISDIYGDCTFIEYLNYTLVFCKKFDNIRNMFQAFTMDLGYEIIVHEGFKINKKTEGKDLLVYLNFFATNFNKNTYSKFTDVVIKANNYYPEVIRIIKENVIQKLYQQHTMIELINTFFNNNLNVSLTSKLLYMHRNSLINKLEQIEKITSLDIQKFEDAYVIKILIDYGD